MRRSYYILKFKVYLKNRNINFVDFCFRHIYKLNSRDNRAQDRFPFSL